MISRITGEVSFQSGFHISPHRAIETSHKSQALPLKGWKRHILGSHPSEHGNFEVEAISKDEDRIQLVLLAHQHSFYRPGTPLDAERRAFHEGVISLDLAGQREFSWGEVVCRLEAGSNKDWLVIAYNRDADVPLGEREVLLRLLAHEKIPDEST
jgi:hypothetical protein